MANEEQDSTNSNIESSQNKTGSGFGLRSFFSAAIFGVVGFYVGRWLGWLGDSKGNTLGQRVMSWTGGVMGAVLAAYTSLKTGHREAREEEKARELKMASAASVALEQTPQAQSAQPALKVDSIEHAGTVESPAQQLAR